MNALESLSSELMASPKYLSFAYMPSRGTERKISSLPIQPYPADVKKIVSSFVSVGYERRIESEVEGGLVLLPCEGRTCREAGDLVLLSSFRRKGSYLQSSIGTLREYLMPPMLK